MESGGVHEKEAHTGNAEALLEWGCLGDWMAGWRLDGRVETWWWVLSPLESHRVGPLKTSG